MCSDTRSRAMKGWLARMWDSNRCNHRGSFAIAWLSSWIS
ncbi:hypothetical protein V1278_003990 [Bradyrhizobium sp. AZCC 1577]